MAVAVTEDVGGRGLQALPRADRSNRKPAASEPTTALTPRFFLAKPGANDNAPTLDRELANEAEAMIESLKSGLNYYSVIEYRVVSDCSGKQPIVKKEAVRKGT